jgi:hypothetical protein
MSILYDTGLASKNEAIDAYFKGNHAEAIKKFKEAMDSFLKDIKVGGDDSVSELMSIHSTKMLEKSDLEKTVETCTTALKNPGLKKMPLLMIWLGIIYMKGGYGGHEIASPNFSKGDQLIKRGVKMLTGDVVKNYSKLDFNELSELSSVYMGIRKTGSTKHRLYCLVEATEYHRGIGEDTYNRRYHVAADEGFTWAYVLESLKDERDSAIKALDQGWDFEN